MPTTNFYLSSKNYRELDALAAKDGLTVPRKARQIIEEYLKQEEAKTE